MLSIGTGQLQALQHAAAVGFLRRLIDRLAAETPVVFNGQPSFVREQMVVNGLAVAATFGFTLESTLGGFVALQCQTAADFHHHPLARQVLLAEDSEQRRFERLVGEVSADVWAAIRSGADHRAWFEPRQPSQQAVRIAARVCAAFPELVDKAPEGALRPIFEASIPRAAHHGIVVETGIAVYAAALAVYGDALDKPGGPAWAAQVFGSAPLPPERQVALLRLRLLLDTDRLV